MGCFYFTILHFTVAKSLPLYLLITFTIKISAKLWPFFIKKNRIVKVSPGGSHLAPARSQWPMNSLVCIGVPTTYGGQGARGASWSEMSEPNIILGFRVPTTIGRKTLIITYSAYVSPPPGSKVPTQCPLT